MYYTTTIDVQAHTDTDLQLLKALNLAALSKEDDSGVKWPTEIVLPAGITIRGKRVIVQAVDTTIPYVPGNSVVNSLQSTVTARIRFLIEKEDHESNNETTESKT